MSGGLRGAGRGGPRPASRIGQAPFAPLLSLGGLAIVALVSVGLLGGTLPRLPGQGNGNGPGNGPVRTPTPSDVVITDPRADVPGSLLYVKAGNVWIQEGDEARQLTDGGRDAMPAWSRDGAWIYFIRTAATEGRWPSGGVVRPYQLEVPSLLRISADGTGEPEVLLSGLVRRSGNTWSAILRQPAVAPDGTTIAVVTDAPNPVQSDVVVKLLDLAEGALADPGFPQSGGLGHQDPAWSPDGSVLLFVRAAREGARGTPVIMRHNLANGRTNNVSGPGYLAPSWSPDGRFIVATKTSNFGTDVVILDARSGVELLRLTNDERSFNPVWSPKGDAIAFFKARHGVVDLYLIPLQGSGPSWTPGEPLALTLSAGLQASSRPAWFIPADQLPPPTPTPAAPSPTGTDATAAPSP